MAKLSDKRLRQCGGCGVFLSEGRDIESTNRNSETGLTEYANFICRHCCQEKYSVVVVGNAADKWLREQRGN